MGAQRVFVCTGWNLINVPLGDPGHERRRAGVSVGCQWVQGPVNRSAVAEDHTGQIILSLIRKVIDQQSAKLRVVKFFYIILLLKGNTITSTFQLFYKPQCTIRRNM